LPGGSTRGDSGTDFLMFDDTIRDNSAVSTTTADQITQRTLIDHGDYHVGSASGGIPFAFILIGLLVMIFTIRFRIRRWAP
ncbi:MAG: hypothetical protein KAS67_06740, partial [Thermoplasmata archaeon]|nr:hypothetical protein [Thermoplasmata archaeon]